jgi:hypothetical protein
LIDSAGSWSGLIRGRRIAGQRAGVFGGLRPRHTLLGCKNCLIPGLGRDRVLVAGHILLFGTGGGGVGRSKGLGNRAVTLAGKKT